MIKDQQQAWGMGGITPPHEKQRNPLGKAGRPAPHIGTDRSRIHQRHTHEACPPHHSSHTELAMLGVQLGNDAPDSRKLDNIRTLNEEIKNF